KAPIIWRSPTSAKEIWRCRPAHIRILTTYVDSLPRPAVIQEMLRARLRGEPVAVGIPGGLQALCIACRESAASRVPRTFCFLLAAICGIHTLKRPCQFPHRLLHASAASGEWAMTFEEILDQAIAMLQRRGRLTYGTLKRQFQLDDAALEDLTNELI